MGPIARLTRWGIAWCCVFAGAPGSANPPQATTGGQLNATVTETRLGPSMPAGQFVVSPDGGHLASFSTHGSREVIVVDGVDGPEFDDAGRPNPGTGAIDVAFSSDGKRSAYIAQRGDKWVAVVDGKEAFTVASVRSERTVPGIDQTYLHSTGEGRIVAPQFLFSQSGAHVAVIGIEDRLSYMFLDGVKSPPYADIDLKQVAFVGDKLVYAAATPDRRWHMVVNTALGPAYDQVSSLTLSDNNQYYAFVGHNGVNAVVVAGGATAAPPATFPAIGPQELVVASNGRVAFLAGSEPGTHGPARQMLFVGAEAVSPDIAPFYGTYSSTGAQKTVRVVFSADGSKFAYARQVPGGIAAVIEGKQSIAYDGIGQMHFSPDARRAYFVGMKSGLNFVVIDGQEMPGQGMVKNLQFSADGSRFGYETGASVVLDGKESATFREMIDKTLVFSADGKHSAYAVCTQYSQCQLVEDGTVTNVPRPEDFISRTGPPRIVFPGIFFSPDGSRLVYNANVHSVLVNGKEFARGSTYEFPSFSPDSKHFAVMGWTGKGMTAFVDGVAGPAYDDIVEANRNVARFVDAHTLRFLAVKGGSVYRVLVDLK